MDAYQLGVLTGQIVFWLILLSIIWTIVRVYKKIKQKIFSNPTKELLETYFFWVDFVKGISSIDELKKRLKTICNMYQVNIDENTLQYFIETCGTNMQVLINEIKLKIEEYREDEDLYKSIDSYSSLLKDYLEKQNKNICIHFKKSIFL
jgi:DNA polymerase III delta prime subunit